MNGSSVSNHAFKALSSPQSFFIDQAKANGSSHQTKSLGGASSPLAQWLDEAKNYYNSVMSGKTAKPDGQAWNEFLGQMQWAQTQVYSAGSNGWGDATGQGAAGNPTQVNDFGGELGPDGNWNYDKVSTRLAFTGDQTRNDIYGTDNEIKLDQPSAKVSCEETNDHGVPVLKVLVTTAKGTAVYYYENYQDPSFKLKVSAPNVDNITGEESFPGKVEAKKYDPKQATQKDTPQSSVEGESVDGQDNAYYYEVESVDQTIDFHPKSGDVNETHYVVGNSTISVPVSSQVNVAKSDQADYDYKVVVTHKDGKTDTYYVKKQFTAHINAVADYTTWDLDGNGTPDTVKAGKVPDEVKDIFSVSGDSTTGSSSSVDSQQIIDDFLSAAGLDNEDQLVAAFQSAGYADFKDISDVKNAIDDGSFPPKDPDNKLVQLLVSLDPDLKQAIKDTYQAATDSAGKPDADTKVKAKMQLALDRLQELLKKLYPKSIVEVTDPTGPEGFRMAGGTLTIKNSDGTQGSHQIYVDPNGNFYI